MAYTPANPWNFPMWRNPSRYDAVYSDSWYTAANSITDFSDTGAVTAICAVFWPLGYNPSGQNYDSTWPREGNTYNHVFTIGKKGSGIDNNIFIRGIWDAASAEPRLQCYTYDGTSYRGITVTPAMLGYCLEGKLLQIAFVSDPGNQRIQVVVNGQYFTTGTSGLGSLNLHSANSARICLLQRANTNSDIFTSLNCAEGFQGPLLINDAAIDLTPESADYNRIFDENGDFLWAGEDGALWLHDTGVTKPWYFSENFAPLTQKGTMTATWTNYGASNVYGHMAGTKRDYTMRPAHMDLAEATSGIQLLWDMTQPWGFHNMWFTNPVGVGDALVRANSTYTNTRMPPWRSGEYGSIGYDFGNSVGIYGVVTYSGSHPMCALANGATQLALTYTMDFSEGANETFGYQKIAGWGDASSSAIFRVTGPWPSENSRHINIACYPANSAQFYMGYTVPNDTGKTAWTWQWNNGLMKCWVNGVVRNTVDRTSTDTALIASSQQFGFRSYTASASGNIVHSTNFLMVNTVAMTDQQIIDLHAALVA